MIGADDLPPTSKTLLWILTFGFLGFMMIHGIFLDEIENMSRGGVLQYTPPPGIPMYHIIQKNPGVSQCVFEEFLEIMYR